ncbi:hypothetical protein HID58_013178, partial [Brassica napus]
MIKNRKSAARSRARKQAYMLELEAEVAQLKEMNEELHRKQVFWSQCTSHGDAKGNACEGHPQVLGRVLMKAHPGKFNKEH